MCSLNKKVLTKKTKDNKLHILIFFEYCYNESIIKINL